MTIQDVDLDLDASRLRLSQSARRILDAGRAARKYRRDLMLAIESAGTDLEARIRAGFSRIELVETRVTFAVDYGVSIFHDFVAGSGDAAIQVSCVRSGESDPLWHAHPENNLTEAVLNRLPGADGLAMRKSLMAVADDVGKRLMELINVLGAEASKSLQSEIFRMESSRSFTEMRRSTVRAALRTEMQQSLRQFVPLLPQEDVDEVVAELYAEHVLES